MNDALATVLLLVAAVNPLRLRGTVSGEAAGRGGADRTVTLTGAAAAAAGLAGAVLTGAAVLEVLRVSAATAMLAAGLVAVATGLHDLVTGAADPVAGPAAWHAGIVPVAFPLVLRPAPVLAALALGAARATAVTAVAAGLAGVLGAVAARRPHASRWAAAGGRLLAGLLVLLGVDLGIDGALRV